MKEFTFTILSYFSMYGEGKVIKHFDNVLNMINGDLTEIERVLDGINFELWKK
jgi:hypothetical protein